MGTRGDLSGAIAHSADRVIDAAGAVVIPGFVDAHTHLVFAGSRADEFEARSGGATYEEIAARGGGIRRTVADTIAASDEELLNSAAARAREALAAGTTTLEVKSGYGLSTGAELRLLGVIAELSRHLPQRIVATLLPLHALPVGVDEPAHVDDVINNLLPQARPLARFCDAFCDRGAFSEAACREVLGVADALGYGIRIHAEQLSHQGGALLAAQLRAASADHLEHATREDAAALAAAGVVGVLLPGAHLTLGGRDPDARMMLAAGMKLAVATDCNPGTSNTTDMRLMVALAVLQLGMTPGEALLAATRGGALSLREPDRGWLGPGAWADLTFLDAASHVEISYRLGRVPVSRVMIAGVEALGPGASAA